MGRNSGSGKSFTARIDEARQAWIDAKNRGDVAGVRRAKEKASNLQAERTKVMAVGDQATRVRRMLAAPGLTAARRTELEGILAKAQRDYKRGRKRLGI